MLTKKLAKQSSTVIAGLLIIITSSTNNNVLMNGTQSGKTFLFCAAILLLIMILSLHFLVQTRIPKKSFTLIDILVTVYFAYSIINKFIITGELISSTRILETILLFIFYLIVRQFHSNTYKWLFLAVIIAGITQGIHGNLQLWNYLPSHHSLYKMTGSFFNPGPYAGYLVSIFPIALGLYLFKINFHLSSDYFNNRLIEQRIHKVRTFSKKQRIQIPGSDKLIQLICILSMIFIVLVLPASRSRAAWLAVIISSVYLLAIKYKNQVLGFLHQTFNSTLKKVGTLILLLIIAGGLLAGLYHLKKGSADGRILIWDISLNMIKDKPIFGYGLDQFKAHYMDYQADYFEKNPDSGKAFVAGDTNYAFNEILQLTIENGIIGLLLIVVLITIIFLKTLDSNEEQKGKNNIVIAAKAGILSIVIFSLFSYPSQILPIKMNLILYLVIIARYSTKQYSIHFPKVNAVIKWPLKITTTIILVSLLYFGVNYIQKLTNAYTKWKNAFDLYNMGAYDACLDEYKAAFPMLHSYGDFLTNYGKALSMAEEQSNAIEILEQAKIWYPNTVVFTALGDSYKQTGRINEAEKAYIHAWYMNPSRFYPKYLLAKLYHENGQEEKARNIATELLNKEIKIQSTAIEEIKAEMRKILE